MQKVYRNTTLFIILVMFGVQWGFYQNYTSQFPHFIDKTIVIHVHGVLLMCWLILLIAQPLLIRSGKAKLHRVIGKVSWVLGPMIIISLFFVGRGSYGRSVGNTPENVILAIMALDIRGLFSFALLWALAMFFRKDSSTHMRYMIATGILGIGPGIGRGLMHSFDYSIWDALTITDVLDLAIVGFLLGYDIYRKKNYKPFLVVFIVMLVSALLWQARDTDAWQSFARHYAAAFYY